MTTAIARTGISFNEFINCYGDDKNYELIDGELIDMEPTGLHEQVGAFVSRKLNVQIDLLDLPYFIVHCCLLKPLGIATAFRPDIMVLDEAALSREPLWTREPIITMGTTVKLVVEVVSTNWQNDYARKYEDYEALEIPEYWLVDHLGLGGKYYIGSPKQPTITLCRLVDGEYQKTILHSGDRIQTPLFPDLDLPCDRLFTLAESA
ncbi:Uma2 family endonuclease [Spirulina sp. 06S082]|uniref:Uma2 family endonuclease n=1 Tax=Spirulina sp. 06S082 TaxID=3110248 RepID=UPI002B1F8B8F|nr:Uma2 family endonuclease [Spirulina sp. 06S082]MEA5472321.1 Uma2 family endonuclease [Spirulina sp. 06S082]